MSKDQILRKLQQLESQLKYWKDELRFEEQKFEVMAEMLQTKFPDRDKADINQSVENFYNSMAIEFGFTANDIKMVLSFAIRDLF